MQIWTEYTERNPSDQSVGNVNFLPGMGAFLQSVIYGFAGLRIRPDKLEVHNPTPPPGAREIKLRNLYYLGTNMTLTVTDDTTTVDVISSSARQPMPLVLRRNVSGAVEENLTPGMQSPSRPLLDCFYCGWYLISGVVVSFCLQCFDAVGWAAGRASSL